MNGDFCGRRGSDGLADSYWLTLKQIGKSSFFGPFRRWVDENGISSFSKFYNFLLTYPITTWISSPIFLSLTLNLTISAFIDVPCSSSFSIDAFIIWIYRSIFSANSDSLDLDIYVCPAPYSIDGFLVSPLRVSLVRTCLILCISASISLFLTVLLSSSLNYKMVDLNSSIILRYSSEFLIW